MPRKDPEEFKAYQREQMRQRRAQAKAEKAGANLPPASAGTPTASTPGKKPPPIAGNSGPEAVPVEFDGTLYQKRPQSQPNTPAPATKIDKPLAKDPVGITRPLNNPVKNREAGAKQPDDPARKIGIVTDIPPGGYWTRFPGQTGRACFNDSRYMCCYDLNFPVPWERYYCPGHPDKPCGYSKPVSLFDLAGVQ